MKRLTILLLLAFFSLHCEKGAPLTFEGENCIEGMPAFDPEPIPHNSQYRLVFFKNSRIEAQETSGAVTQSIEPGDNLVFLYEYEKNDSPLIADDEYTERILFEIPAGIDTFLISGEDLKKSNAIYGNLCFCLDRGHFRIDDGCIKGEKVDGKHWKVAMNISAQASQTTFSKMLSEIFKEI